MLTHTVDYKIQAGFISEPLSALAYIDTVAIACSDTSEKALTKYTDHLNIGASKSIKSHQSR